jgi:excisionase family DNA binding protein
MPLPDRDWLRIVEVADYFNIDQQTVRRLIAAGKLKTLSINSALRVSRASVLAFENNPGPAQRIARRAAAKKASP